MDFYKKWHEAYNSFGVDETVFYVHGKLSTVTTLCVVLHSNDQVLKEQLLEGWRGAEDVMHSGASRTPG